jgi:plasmid stabilization system protein ParE
VGTVAPEKDWKYLRSIQRELLLSLCERINRKAMEILRSGEMSEHEKYKVLYHHVKDSDEIIAHCFDDWRRSNIVLKVMMLHSNGLLTEEDMRHLSDETRNLLKSVNLRKAT